MTSRHPLARVCAALFLLPLMLALQACSTSHELTESERAMLVTEADFPAPDQQPRTASGEFTKTADYANRSTELSYESPEASIDVFVYSTISIEKSASGALGSELAYKGGLKIGLASQGIKEQPVPLTRSYGKRAALNLLVLDGKPVGNTFFAAIDHKVLTVMFTGHYFDNEADFAAFIEPRLAAIRAYAES